MSDSPTRFDIFSSKQLSMNKAGRTQLALLIYGGLILSCPDLEICPNPVETD
jgi:hypothetical protein